MLIKTKFRIPDVFLGMMLLIAVFVMGVCFSSGYRQQNNGNPNNQADNSAKEIAAPVTYWDIFGTKIASADALAALLVVATIAIGGITACGIFSQRRETKILQRAYISAEPEGLSPFLPRDVSSAPTNKTYVGHISFRNAGRLPARNVKWYLDSEHSTDGGFVPVRYGDLTGQNVISPGEAMTQGSIEVSIPDSRQGYVYVWGKITYNDGFGKERRTVFCHRYNLRRLERGKGPNAGFFRIRSRYGRHHNKGNDST